MNRRSFFKRVAVTCAIVVAAPAVVQGSKKMTFSEAAVHYNFQLDKVRDFGTCGNRALQELIAERRKQTMTELGDIFEETFWRTT